MSMLRDAFHSGLTRALEPINQQVDRHAKVKHESLWGLTSRSTLDSYLCFVQEFHKCFPSFDKRHAMAFYDLYRQVSGVVLVMAQLQWVGLPGGVLFLANSYMCRSCSRSVETPR